MLDAIDQSGKHDHHEYFHIILPLLDIDRPGTFFPRPNMGSWPASIFECRCSKCSWLVLCLDWPETRYLPNRPHIRPVLSESWPTQHSTPYRSAVFGSASPCSHCSPVHPDRSRASRLARNAFRTPSRRTVSARAAVSGSFLMAPW